MKTKLLCSLCLCVPLALPAAKVRRVTPLTTDRSVKIEVALSADAGEQVSLEAVIAGTKDGQELCRTSRQFFFSHPADTTLVLRIDSLTPRLWSPASPVLYNLEVSAGAHTYRQRIGFRKFESRDGRFNLCSRTKQPGSQKCWTDISHLKGSMKVTLKGDRRAVLLKTILKVRD